MKGNERKEMKGSTHKSCSLIHLILIEFHLFYKGRGDVFLGVGLGAFLASRNTFMFRYTRTMGYLGRGL